MKFMTIAYKDDPTPEMLRYSCLNAKKIFPDISQVVVTTKEVENTCKTLLSDLNYVEIISTDLPDIRQPLIRWLLVYYGYKNVNDDIMYCGTLTFFKKDLRSLLHPTIVNVAYSKVEKIDLNVVTYIESIAQLIGINPDLDEVVHSSFMFLPLEASEQVEKINSLVELHRSKLSKYGKDIENDYNVNFALTELKDELFLLQHILLHLTTPETNNKTDFVYNTETDNPYLLYTYPHEFQAVKDQIPI